MYSQDIEIIADTLCNIFDWDSQDLRSDFIQALKENDLHISSELAEKIFDNFINLDVVTRSSPGFNFHEFISAHYIS